MNEFQSEDQSFDFNIFHYIGLVRKHLFLIVGFLILGVGLAFISYMAKPPLYKSTVLIKMDHMSNDVIGFADQMRWNPYRTEYFKTEFRIIQSLPVAEVVVRSLGLKFFEQGQAANKKPNSLFSLWSSKQPAEKPVEISESKKITMLARGILGGVSIQELSGTNLVRISYTHTNPKWAKKLANTWIEAYITHSLNMTYDKNMEAYTYLQAKAEEYQIKIANLYNELASKKDSPESAVKGRAKSASEEQALVNLNNELSVANRNYIERRSALQALNASSPSQSSEVAEDVIIQDLVSKVAAKKTEYDTNLNIYKPQLPKMQALKKEIEALQDRLITEQTKRFNYLIVSTSKDVSAGRQEVNILEENIKRQNVRIIRAQIESQELSSSLDSRIAVLEQNSQVIEKKKESLELALGLKDIGRTDKVVVESARMPGGPFAPSLQRFLMSGTVFSLALAGCIIFLIEVTDRKIHNTEVLEGVTHLPTLATIPKLPGLSKNAKLPRDLKKRKEAATRLRQESGLQTHLKPNDPFSESYRHLRTNIQLSKTTANQVFLFTSAISGEGKTISSLNLAISFSQLDKKVLIVDCDLRRPKLHKIFNLPNQVGLVNALVKHKTVRELAVPTKVPNLYLLAAGPLSPNPAELIASKRMNEVIEEFKELFDYVIIDTAPLLAVTDACILGNLVDSLVFVTQASSTSRDEVARAIQMLNQNQIKPLGTLFNSYDFTKGKKYYGYKYGYRYKYGYGYGYVPYSYDSKEES